MISKHLLQQKIQKSSDHSNPKASGISPQLSEKSMLLACSTAKREDDLQRVLRAAQEGRALLSDRRRPFSHLRPQPFLKSCIRVAAVQASTIYATFLADQLEAESKRDELVKDEKLSEKEADIQNEEWEKREWEARWKNFSTKVYHGILKFQAITLTMRFFEQVASQFFDEVTLDRLTQDPFKAAQRTAKRTSNSSQLRREMYDTCFWSNIIAFLADFSVHQIILGYGYYIYYRDKRRRLRKQRESGEPEDDLDGAGPLALSFGMKSCKLAVSRSLGLVCASIGGAYGSVIWPGWGTMIGTQFGDGLVGAVLDDLHVHALPGQKF